VDADPPAEYRSGEKTTNRYRGGQRRQPGVRLQGEAEEHDVSGHVGDEHMPHPQIADRVDQTGDRREYQQGGHHPAAADRHVHDNLPGACFSAL